MQKVVNSTLNSVAMRFIDMVYGYHTSGSGFIPVKSLVQMFGIELDSSQSLKVGMRGDISLNAKDDISGTFQNVGAATHIQHGLATLTTPRLISGLYLSDPDHCFFRFDPMHTIFGAAYLILSSRLESIYVDRNVIKIKMEDEQLGQIINHSMPVKLTGLRTSH